MKRALTAITTTLVLSSSASANTVDGFYIRADAGAAQDMTRAAGISPSLGGGNVKLKSKPSLIADVGIGYNVSRDFRVELIFMHRFDPKLHGSRAIATRGIPGNFSTKTKAKIEALMIRGQFDIYEFDWFSSFLSLGVGVSQVSHKGYNVTSLSNGASRNRGFTQKKKNNCVYTIGAGGSFQLNDKTSLDIQYGWYDFGTAKNSNIKYRTHAVTAGLRYQL